MSHFVMHWFPRYKESRKYSWRGGVIVALVSTILLWWFPVIGALISGYVTGRSSGSKFKGLMSSSFAVLVIGALSFVLTYILPVSSPATIHFSHSFVNGLGTFSAYGAWYVSSIGSVFTNFPRFLYYFPTVWAILLVSSFFGGSISELLSKGGDKKTALSHPGYASLQGTKPLKPKIVDYSPEKSRLSLGELINMKHAEERKVEAYDQKAENEPEEAHPVPEKNNAAPEPLFKIFRQERDDDSDNADTDYI